MNEFHYIIYTITNIINGKIYIGKHKCRRLDDRYFGSGKILKEAIRKYGRENFIMKLEIDLKNQAEMDLLEELVVNREFIERDDTYNISRGGKNPCMYGKDNPFFGKTHSNDVRKIISDANRGKTMPDESRKMISASLIRNYIDHPELKQICAVKTGKRKCKSHETGEIAYFDKDNIPAEFEPFNERKDRHVSAERKAEVAKQRSERSSGSRWFNDGQHEVFCRPELVPNGYRKGRLPGLNVGRKYSEATIHKMRETKLGKKTHNAGLVAITNGHENKYVRPDSGLPAGWRYGMTRFKGRTAGND